MLLHIVTTEYRLVKAGAKTVQMSQVMDREIRNFKNVTSELPIEQGN